MLNKGDDEVFIENIEKENNDNFSEEEEFDGYEMDEEFELSVNG